MVNKAISFFCFLCYNYYGDYNNMDTKELKSEILLLEEKLNNIWGYFDVDNKKKELSNKESKLQILYDNNLWNAKETIDLSKEIGNDKKIISNIESLKQTLESYIDVVNSNDDELINELINEIKGTIKKINLLELETKLSGKNDKKNAILEIHSGAGGTESCDWADMLLRMYLRWCDKKNFKYEILDTLPGEEAGIKKVIVLVKGLNAYGYLKCERGVHRLVRLSPFDSQNRRHTSFAAVEVIPEENDDINIEIKDSDIRVDVYRSSGAGGQGVNTTDSAVRITYLPTNTVVTCQNERSQLKNKEQAMKVLKSKIYEDLQKKQNAEIEDERRSKIGTGDRAEKIRTYNYPQNRVTDHRINLTIMQLDRIMQGKLDEIIEALINEDQRRKLAGE